jgi:endonuclease III
MGKESYKNTVKKIIEILEKEYPDAKTALTFKSPLELLISTVLSAQCTDERVNKVTKELFTKYRSAKDYARADLTELENDIRSTGFFRNKAKSIKAFCTTLLEKFNGEVPDNLKDLVSLTGIGRKTANVVLSEVYGIPGIVVDTHVLRLSKLIGLSNNKDATKVEFDLMEIVPKEKWRLLSNLLMLHGRSICVARRPRHQECKIVDLCKEGVRWKKHSLKI